MPKKNTYGSCILCKREDVLTFEHIPPRSTFNKHTTFRISKFHDYLTSDDPLNFKPRTRQLQGGIGYYSLCSSCNSFLGREYVPAYREWVAVGASLLPVNDFELITVVFDQISALRVFKQIIAMFLSINHENKVSAFNRDPEIQSFVKNPINNHFPDKYRLFMYLKNKTGTRYCPFFFQSNRGIILLASELAFPPYGFVLTDNFKGDLPHHQEITDLGQIILDDRVSRKLKLPVLPTVVDVPLDYRSLEEVQQTIERNKQIRE